MWSPFGFGLLINPAHSIRATGALWDHLKIYIEISLANFHSVASRNLANSTNTAFSWNPWVRMATVQSPGVIISNTSGPAGSAFLARSLPIYLIWAVDAHGARENSPVHSTSMQVGQWNPWRYTNSFELCTARNSENAYIQINLSRGLWSAE